VSPEVYSSYVEVIKFIVLREAALDSFRSLLRRSGETYWLYALYFLETEDNSEECLNYEVPRLLRSLRRHQEQITVSLAHIRSLSVSVIEAIRAWRLETAKTSQVRDLVSIYWKRENYLLKMKNDVCFILNDPLMNMWLGFEPNTFMVPPRGHQPAAPWRRMELRFQEWLGKYRLHKKRAIQLERMHRSALVVKPPGLRDRGHIDSMHAQTHSGKTSFHSPAVFHSEGSKHDLKDSSNSKWSFLSGVDSRRAISARDSSFEDISEVKKRDFLNDEEDNNDPDRCEDEVPNPGTCLDGYRVILRPELAHSSDKGSLSSNNNETSMQIQVLQMNENLNINMQESLAIVLEQEAEELVAPRRSRLRPGEGALPPEPASPVSPAPEGGLDAGNLLPSVQIKTWQALRDLCIGCWLPDVDGKAHPFWDNMQLRPTIVQAAIGFPDTFPSKSLVPVLPSNLEKQCHILQEDINLEERVMDELQSKRAACNDYRAAIDLDMSERGIDTALRASKSQIALESQRRLKYRQQFATTAISINFSPNSASTGGGLGHPGDIGSDSPNVYVGCGSDPENHDDFAIFLTSIDRAHSSKVKSNYESCAEIQLNQESLRSALVHKLAEERELTQVVGSSVVLVKSRRARRAAMEQMRVTPAATLIQKIYRGYRIRKEVKKRHTAWKKIYSVWLIQRAARRMIAIQRARRLKLVYRRDCFLVRREILQKNRAAFIVIKFIRSAAFLMSKMKAALQVSSVEKDVLRKTIIEYNASTVALQKLWRGKLARRNTRLLLSSEIPKMVRPSVIIETEGNDDRICEVHEDCGGNKGLASSVASFAPLSLDSAAMVAPKESGSPYRHRRAMQGSPSSAGVLPSIDKNNNAKKMSSLSLVHLNSRNPSINRQDSDPNRIGSQISQNSLDGTRSLSYSCSLPTLSSRENKALRMRAVRPDHRLNVNELHNKAVATPSMVLTNPSLIGKSLSTLGMLNTVAAPAHPVSPCTPPSKEFSIRDLLLSSFNKSANNFAQNEGIE
jgi:hypothetical protein